MLFKLINRLKYNTNLYNCVNINLRKNTQSSSNAEQQTHFGFETVNKNEKAGKGN